MFRTVMVAVALSGVTLATQAMACETARSTEARVGQARLAQNPAAFANFQEQIGGDAALHVQP